MNKYISILLYLILTLAINLYTNMAYASNNIFIGDVLLKKAALADNQKEQHYYAAQALPYYDMEYIRNNLNTDALIGIGKAYTYLDERTEAKNILMQAYSTYQSNPKVQAALGDFNYYFQDYNTALEFYKLALSSGYLKDYQTNISTAKCYAKLGDLKNADLYYRIALLVNPKSIEARREIANIANMIIKKPTPGDTSTPTIFEDKD